MAEKRQSREHSMESMRGVSSKEVLRKKCTFATGSVVATDRRSSAKKSLDTERSYVDWQDKFSKQVALSQADAIVIEKQEKRQRELKEELAKADRELKDSQKKH